MAENELTIFGVNGMPDIVAGDNLPLLIKRALSAQDQVLLSGDIVVVTQKVVSITEGRLINLADVIPSSTAMELAQKTGNEPSKLEVVLRESKSIIRCTENVLITETKHGFICANSGVDNSNIEEGKLLLLPEDPDASAQKIRKELENYFNVDIAVIISDTFGRPWRLGQTNVAIGVSGIAPLKDYCGISDTYGNVLKATNIAVADQLASTAELVMAKTDRIPVAIIRGYKITEKEGKATDLLRPAEYDLFR